MNDSRFSILNPRFLILDSWVSIRFDLQFSARWSPFNSIVPVDSGGNLSHTSLARLTLATLVSHLLSVYLWVSPHVLPLRLPQRPWRSSRLFVCSIESVVCWLAVKLTTQHNTHHTCCYCWNTDNKSPVARCNVISHWLLLFVCLLVIATTNSVIVSNVVVDCTDSTVCITRQTIATPPAADIDILHINQT